MPLAAHSAHSQHQNAPGLDSHYISAFHHFHPKLDSALHHSVYPLGQGKGAEVWGSNSREGLLRCPATAGPARSPIALRQPLWEQSSRPQTAAAADRAWSSVRYTVCDFNLAGSDMKMLALWSARSYVQFITATRLICLLCVLTGSRCSILVAKVMLKCITLRIS